MIVYLSDAQVLDDTVAFDGLDELLKRAYQGQHEVVLGFNFSAFESSGFREDRRGSKHWLRIEEFLARGGDADARDRTRTPGSRPGARHAEVRVANTAPAPAARWSLVSHTLRDWVRSSLVVLLEDDKDAALIEAAWSIYEADDLVRAWSEMWLTFEHRGGSGQIQTRVQEAGEQERLLAFMDRDRTAPEAPRGRKGPRRVRRAPSTAGDPPEPGKTQALTRAACETPTRHGASPKFACHLLRKLEVENYVPAKILDAACDPERLKAFRAWKRKSLEQKDFDDLKAHFDDPKGRWLAKRLSDMRKMTPSDRDAFEERAGDEFEREVLPLLRAWL